MEEISTLSHLNDTLSGSHIIEKSNFGGVSTAFRWEHKIEYDVEDLHTPAPAGFRVSNIRTFSNPLHTTWFLTYDGIMDEQIWREEHQYGDNSDLFHERFPSYKRARFSQSVPIFGVTNYAGYPYSELEGEGYGVYVNRDNSGVND